MSNSLSVLAPRLLAQGLLALRQMSIMPRLVNNDYSALAAQKGTTIDIPIPSAITATDVTPAATPPATGDLSPTQVQVSLDNWKEAAFQLSDKEKLEVMEGTIPMQASEAVKALANAVDQSILAQYKGIYGYVGTAGTTPFTALTSADASSLRSVLNKQLAPLSDRRAVIDPDAEAMALNVRAFQDMSFSGNAQAIIEGALNRKLGFDWWMDQNVPTHTKGVAGTILIDQADVAVGDTEVHLDGGTTTASVGDIFTVAGDTQTYTVLTASALATADFDITFAPAAKVAWANDAAVTFKASHVVNLGFHRDCFAFASRPLVDEDGLGNIIQSAADPVSGLVMRLEISREHKRTRYAYDILWGTKLVRPELGARLAG